MNTIDMWIGGEQFLPKNIYIKIATVSMSSAIVLWLTHRYRNVSLPRRHD